MHLSQSFPLECRYLFYWHPHLPVKILTAISTKQSRGRAVPVSSPAYPHQCPDHCLPQVVEGISDLTVTRPAFHHSTIPTLAGASKLIPLTPTLYVSPSRPFQHSLVTKQSYLATNNQSWYCQHNSLTMLSSRTQSHGLYQNVPDLKGDQILIIPAPVFRCYSERMYRDLTLPAASPTSQ